jgi:hypothetical protein
MMIQKTTTKPNLKKLIISKEIPPVEKFSPSSPAQNPVEEEEEKTNSVTNDEDITLSAEEPSSGETCTAHTVLPSFCEIVPDEKLQQIDMNGFPDFQTSMLTPKSPISLTSHLGGHYPSAMLFNSPFGLPFLAPPVTPALVGFGRESALVNDISNKRKYEPEFSVQTSNKRGKKHDSTPVEEYVNMAIKLDNYDATGLVYIPHKFIIIHEDKFYYWVTSIKPPEYALSKSSLFEKFDKSRRTNRVNPRENTGRIPIKFLRIDKLSRNGLQINNIQQIEKDLEEIQKHYGTNHIRVITHRDWGYIEPLYFIYEVPAKKV